MLRLDFSALSQIVSAANWPDASHRIVYASAIAAQFVAAAEMNWSAPCGKSLSKYGWKGNERLLTYQDPSSSWEFNRY